MEYRGVQIDYNHGMSARPSYKEQVQRIREEAVLSAVNRLLVTKGYDLMTVDEVAAEAGIAKASLYKHFTSKEQLAGAAMVRVMQRAIEFVDGLQAPPQDPVAPLKELVRWALRMQIAGEMPSLPAQNSKLVAALLGSRDYMDRLIDLSEKLGTWITDAQARGLIDPALPPELVLYTLFARACDPVLGLLRAQGRHPDDQLIDWIVQTTFTGLARPPAAAPAKGRGR
jgi:AcrR family transcriptional regulator